MLCRSLGASSLLLLAATPAAAADHDLSLGLGAVHQQLREELIRPLRWDGPGGVLEVSWGIRGEDHRIETGLRLPLAIVENRYEHGAAALGFRLGSRITWESAALANGTFSLGGGLQGEEALFYSWDWDEEHLYWLTSWSLGPVASWERPLGPRQSLSLSLFLPIAALVSRPPIERFEKIDDLLSVGFYFAKPHSNLAFTSLHEYRSFEARVSWAWAFSDSWDLLVGLEWSWARYTEPVPVEKLSFTLLPLFRHVL